MIRKMVMTGVGGALVAMALAANPAMAQAADPNQPFNDGSAAASVPAPPGVVAPGYDPGVRAANEEMGQTLAQDSASAKARHDAQWRRYHQEQQARRQTIAMIHENQVRREVAYNRAMDAWHAQVAACEQGDRQACMAPTPNPDAYR